MTARGAGKRDRVDLDQEEREAMREFLTPVQQSIWVRSMLAHFECYAIVREAKQYSEDPAREQSWREFFAAAANSDLGMETIVSLAKTIRIAHHNNRGTVREVLSDAVERLDDGTVAMVLALANVLHDTPLHERVTSMASADEYFIDGMTAECRRQVLGFPKRGNGES